MASTQDGELSADAVLPEEAWGNLFATLGDASVEFGRRVQGELPVEASVCWMGIGGGTPVKITDPAMIRSLFNALAASGVVGEATTMTTDDYFNCAFKFEDGTSFGFNFDSMVVSCEKDGKYRFYDVSPTLDLGAFRQMAYKHTTGGSRSGAGL